MLAASAALLIKKLSQRDSVSDQESQVLNRALARVRMVEADTDIVKQGSRPSDSCLILSGFAARYKVLEDGRRQITAIHVPGDFVDLHSFLLHPMDHSVVALSACRIGVFPHETLREITETEPHLTRLLWLSTLIDGAIHREWLLAMGRMLSLGRTAHLICELFLRLQAVDLVSDNSFRFPITQAELSDALGLSTVHVNRVVQELRSTALITWQGDRIKVLDWEGLSRAAEFDPTYLQHNREPR